MSKKKLAVIALGGHGHVNPTLPVVTELTRRGVEVLYFCTEEFRSSIEATGAEFFAYDSLFIRATAANIKKLAGDGSPEAKKDAIAALPMRFLDDALHVLPQILPILKDKRPNAIWHDDMVVAGKFASELLGLPSILSHSSYVANDHFAVAAPLAKLDIHTPIVVEFNLKAQTFAKEHHITPLTLEGLVMGPRGILHIVFMPRAFQPFGETYGRNFAFVGPSIAPRLMSDPLVLPQNGYPLIFISLGTIFNDWPEFFRMCFEAFEGQPYQVVMAVGNKVDQKSLGPIPKNFVVMENAPQLEILPQTHVFITHGGMNSVQESLYFGIPMLVIPQMQEQRITASRVEELGLGKAIMDRTLVNATSLRNAVATITSDMSIQKNLGTIQAASRSSGGHILAADLILSKL